MKNTKFFGFTSLFGMILFLLLIHIGAENQFQSKTKSYANSVFSTALLQLNDQWIKPLIQSPEEAKKNQLFWINTERQLENETALDVLSNPDLYDSLFPGFGEVRSNSHFWKKYFTTTFDSFSYSTALYSRSPLIYGIHTSFEGCLKMAMLFHTDILVLGNSEVYRSVIPKILSDHISQSDPSRKLKLSFCPVSSGLSIESLKQLTTHLESNHHKIPLLIYGFSLWYSNLSPFLRKIEIEKKPILDRLTESLWKKNSELKDFFPQIKWNDFFDVDLIHYLENKNAITQKINERSDRENNKNPIPTDSPFYFNKSVSLRELNKKLNDPSTLKMYTYAGWEGFDKNTIKEVLTDFFNQSKSTLESLDRVFDKTLIFVTPTSQVHTSMLPDGYETQINQFFEKFETPHFKFMPRNQAIKGFTFLDYLQVTNNRDVLHFDANHSNLDGAKKFTSTLAEEIIHFK